MQAAPNPTPAPAPQTASTLTPKYLLNRPFWTPEQYERGLELLASTEANYYLPSPRYAFLLGTLFEDPLGLTRDVNRAILKERQKKEAATTNFQTGFTIFATLPPELQIIIWKLAIPGPQVLPIEIISNRAHPFQTNINWTVNTSQDEELPEELPPGTIEIRRAPCSVPCGLLAACHDSRQVILERYDCKLNCFNKIIRFHSTDVIVIGLGLKHSERATCPGFVFDIDADIFGGLNYSGVFSDVQNLAIIRPANTFINSWRLIWIMQQFKNVKTLIDLKESWQRSHIPPPLDMSVAGNLKDIRGVKLHKARNRMRPMLNRLSRASPAAWVRPEAQYKAIKWNPFY